MTYSWTIEYRADEGMFSVTLSEYRSDGSACWRHVADARNQLVTLADELALAHPAFAQPLKDAVTTFVSSSTLRHISGSFYTKDES